MKLVKGIKKFFKILGWTLVILVALIVIAIFTHPFWLGPIATSAANKVAPQFVGGDFHVDKLNLHVDVLSCFTDVIVIKDIEVKGLYVDYVAPKDEQPEDNSSWSMPTVDGVVNAVGNATDKAVNAVENAHIPNFEFKSEEEGTKFNKKLIIERINIEDVSGKYEGIPFAAPHIELHDMGKDSGGYDLDEMGMALTNEIIASVLAEMKDLGKFVGNILGDGEGLGEEGLKEAGKELKKAEKMLKGLFK